jgi:hypothetical protein
MNAGRESGWIQAANGDQLSFHNQPIQPFGVRTHSRISDSKSDRRMACSALETANASYLG